MRKFLLFTVFFAVSLMLYGAESEKITPIYSVRGELNAAQGHIQGMCISDTALYLSHQGGIFKLDRNGKLLKHVKAPVHTGDICFADGKLYAAVAYYDKARKGKGRITVYDADLNEIGKHELPRPSDGITCLGGYLYFGLGPNPQKPHRVNRIGRLKADFSDELKIFEIDFGYPTHFGTQAISNDGKFLYMCFYGAGEHNFAVYTPDMQLRETSLFHGSVGFDHLIINGKSTFIRLKQLYKYKKKETPYFMFDFFRYTGGKMKNITQRVKK